MILKGYREKILGLKLTPFQKMSMEISGNLQRLRGKNSKKSLQKFVGEDDGVKYLKKEWKLPKDFKKAVFNQQNNMPYDFIDTPRHKLEVDFHEFRKHLKSEIN